MSGRSNKAPKELRERIICKAEEDGFSYHINKTVATEEGFTFYLLCSNVTSDACKVKLTVKVKGDEVGIKIREEHLHKTPSKRHLSPEIKESVEKMAKNHVPPGQIHENLTKEFPLEHLGSKRQIKYLCNLAFSIPSGNFNSLLISPQHLTITLYLNPSLLPFKSVKKSI